MLFKKKISLVAQPRIERHFIFMEIPFEFAAPYVLLWGEGGWWPKECGFRLVKETPGETRLGTRFRIQSQDKRENNALAEVTNYTPNRFMELTFQRGASQGKEIISVGERANGTRVDYEMHYIASNVLDRMFWDLRHQKKHARTVDIILNALKNHVVSKYQEKNVKPHSV